MEKLRPTPPLSKSTKRRQCIISKAQSRPRRHPDSTKLQEVSSPSGVSIPDDKNDDGASTLLDNLPVNEKLMATNKLHMVFDADLPQDTTHVIVQRPQELPHQRTAALKAYRQLLSSTLDSLS
ncbi:MAG: hypothetical protein J3R72DRAFT_493526 [Linnemannia gamsii]|nr:MAG: hypothetical protein J3R72DRAFT_493526 [Linnemannia gamsii]